MRKQKGFTLIELLVVIAIIGLLATIATVSLTSARQKARDVKRIADVRQIQTALELYFSDHTEQGYPITPGGFGEVILGRETGYCGDKICNCINNSGIQGTDSTNPCGASSPIYMAFIPPAPKPPEDNNYKYHAYQEGESADCNQVESKCATYTIFFTLERPNSDLGNGINCQAKPGGISCE